jgi:hypothetical protein
VWTIPRFIGGYIAWRYIGSFPNIAVPEGLPGVGITGFCRGRLVGFRDSTETILEAGRKINEAVDPELVSGHDRRFSFLSGGRGDQGSLIFL